MQIPQFSDPGNGDFTLMNSSPAINAGNNDALPEGLTTDLAGNARIFDGAADPDIVDMGAYEFQGDPAGTINPDGDNILYVDQNVDGGDGSGSSWGNAIPELADALAWAQDWDADTDGTLQIWVADGLYLPTSDDTDRDATFQLVDGVEIYGGFAGGGGESDLDDRDWTANLTILSGDIDGNDATTDGVVTDSGDIDGDNSYHVVTGSGSDATAILDGVTITGGLANGLGSQSDGGGMYNNAGSPTLSNLTFSGNSAEYGGGMYNNDSSSPTLSNATFSGNSASESGGGVFNVESSPTLANVTFSENSAHSGGGMANVVSSSPSLINATFSGNSAEFAGGMYNSASSPTLSNVTFSGNSANQVGGGMYNSGSNPTMANVIIWDNEADGSTTSASASIVSLGGSTPVISHSLIANSGGSDSWNGDLGTDDGNNIDADPQFTDPGNGDFTLTNTSPAINAGNNDALPGGITTDLAGNARIFDGAADPDIVDMGAYEFQGDPLTTPEQVVLSTPADDAENTVLTPEFSWESLDGADEYYLQVSQNSDLSSLLIDESELESNTFEPTSDLDYSATYYWRVRASNAAGDGPWSEVFSFTTLPESSEVVILTDPSDEAEDVPLKPLFEWNTADGADSYDLVVSPNSDYSDPVIDENEIENTEFQTNTDLDFTTMYYWRVRGVNSGGTGQWSEPFSFTTLTRPEASDNRILLANTESYMFTPSDFGTTDNSFTIVIEDLPGGFSGQLQVDGNSVNTDDEISVGDIDNGDLIYTPPAGIYGYGYDSFEFSIEDAGGNPSENSYTMSLDVAATSVMLSYDGPGWRFLSSPSDGEAVGDLFSPIWTQGFSGSDNPAADFPNIYRLNKDEYEWEPVASDNSALDAGDAVIAYVYADDDNNGSDDGFPKTLTSSAMNWNELDGLYDETLAYDSDQQETGDSFYLWGNPYSIAVDLCDFEMTSIAENAYFWNPSLNGGNGGYENLSCNVGEDAVVPVAPFQSVWLRITDMNNDIAVPADAYIEGTTNGYFKGKASPDNFLITLNVSSWDQKENHFAASTRILFDDEASAGSDLLDAPMLSSAGLANRYLSFFSMDDDNQSYELQALPSIMDDKVSIPLDIQTTETGQFEVDWLLPESHVQWQLLPEG
ncbi:MAG: choice-of-anchor Q domain-containing protein [Balneolaceae bacterium]|nr:choice-of-anchor Q domain-containing protein [Balneolaceae bacterium]